MTSAPVHVVSLLCTETDAETYDKRKSFDLVCICLTAQTASQMDECVVVQPDSQGPPTVTWDQARQSEQSHPPDYYLYKEMKTIAAVKALVFVLHCIHSEIHHALDIKTYGHH